MKKVLLSLFAVALGLVLFGCVSQTPSPSPLPSTSTIPTAVPSAMPTLTPTTTPTLKPTPTATSTPTIAPQPTADYSCITDADCAKGGCSGQLCANKNYVQNIATTCEWFPWYACYQQASCLCVQGKCQFDSSVAQCLQRMQNQSSPTSGSGSGYSGYAG